VVAVVQDSGLCVLSVTVTAGNGATATVAPPSQLLLPVTQHINTVHDAVIDAVLVQLKLAYIVRRCRCTRQNKSYAHARS
jgi:hypothetical protein